MATFLKSGSFSRQRDFQWIISWLYFHWLGFINDIVIPSASEPHSASEPSLRASGGGGPLFSPEAKKVGGLVRASFFASGEKEGGHPTVRGRRLVIHWMYIEISINQSLINRPPIRSIPWMSNEISLQSGHPKEV